MSDRLPSRLVVFSLASSAFLFANPSFAAETSAVSEPSSVDGAELAAAGDAILVTGRRLQYGIGATRTATKTDTDIRNIPQALTVISEAQIEDQSLRSVGDLLMFVPGATPGTGEGNRDQMTLRGNNTTADFFVDGVRDDVQYFRDFYNVDRVEVLKGPNAMIFGRGGGGGVVNRVLKRATLGTARQFSLSGDRFGGLRASGDLDQALGQSVGIRVNAMVEDGDSFRRHVDLKRYGINPAIGVLAGPDTRIDLSYEFVHDRRTADRGLPASNGEPIRGQDRTFFGDPDRSYSKADVNMATIAVEHNFGAVSLRNRTSFADYDKFYQNIYPSAFNSATGIVTLGAYNSRNDRRNLFSQTDLVWKSSLAGVDQTLLVGIELGRQTSRNQRLSGTIVGGSTTPLADATVDREVIFAPVGSDANNRTRATVAAAYVQEQLRPTSWLEIVAGLRFDSFKLTVDDLRPAVNAGFGRRDTLWSPRLGVVVKPRDNLSLYAGYARSYLPQSGDQFSGLDISTQALKPERFDNYELGAKWEPVEGLLATAAVYQLDRINTRAAGPVAGTVVLTGAQRSRGLELGLERSVTDDWQISAGYSWQKAEIVETTSAAPAGRTVPLVPRHSLSLWNRYAVTKQLGVGLGLIARSKSYASISNSVKLPRYARVDAALFYKLAGGVEVQVNAENLFNANYYPTAHNDNNIAPGAPRMIKGTVRFGF